MDGPVATPAHPHSRVTTVATAVSASTRSGRRLRSWGVAFLFMLAATAYIGYRATTLFNTFLPPGGS